jgi:hypothetical protein
VAEEGVAGRGAEVKQGDSFLLTYPNKTAGYLTFSGELMKLMAIVSTAKISTVLPPYLSPMA